ncbi:MAG: hypothetical protein EB023_04545 [Flavobacteriia bacterium]|nr:hypothetical protein [Flavobacteriia bacterium]
MPRLYLTLVALCFSLGVSAQVKIKDLIEFGDEQFRKGDYYYASGSKRKPSGHIKTTLKPQNGMPGYMPRTLTKNTSYPFYTMP